MGRRILIVDDDVMNIRRAENALKQEQYDILSTDSGQGCLNILKIHPVDLILLDIEMPQMSGMKTLEAIRKQEGLAGIPVIFLTASADSDNVMEAVKLGAVDYVRKPFEPQELLKRVARAFGG